MSATITVREAPPAAPGPPRPRPARRSLGRTDPPSGWFDPVQFVDQLATDALRHGSSLTPLQAPDGPHGPMTAHVTAANELVAALRRQAMADGGRVKEAASRHRIGRTRPTALQAVVVNRRAVESIRAAEVVWQYYRTTFDQRVGPVGRMLRACDRIALDCYEAVYSALPAPRSIPSPPPLTRLDSDRSPATLRRGVGNPWIGRLPNPFPIVTVPFHRLVNPWSLGAVHHEVAHNLQADLGLWPRVPPVLVARLRRAGVARAAIGHWARWHKEIWADLVGILLGGPAVVRSLVDVLAKPSESAGHLAQRAVHPPSVIRVLLAAHLLDRLGFAADAAGTRALYGVLYPRRTWRMPPTLRASVATAVPVVVDAICFHPYDELGGRTLASITHFGPEHRTIAREAAQRLTAGNDPGVIPERFLVEAVRWALHSRLARPATLSEHFYRALAER